MSHYSSLECFYIAGAYNGGESIIGCNNGQLRGQWLTINRPNFIGYVSADCKGNVTFPEDRIYKLEFDKVSNKIFWEGRTYGKIWTKGDLLFFEKVLVKIFLLYSFPQKGIIYGPYITICKCKYIDQPKTILLGIVTKFHF